MVSLVPPQSYFDVQSTEYSHNVYKPPADPWHQEFHYAGRNVYAYWVAKFGRTELDVVSQLNCVEAESEGWEIVNFASDFVAIFPEDKKLGKLTFYNA